MGFNKERVFKLKVEKKTPQVVHLTQNAVIFHSDQYFRIILLEEAFLSIFHAVCIHCVYHISEITSFSA